MDRSKTVNRHILKAISELKEQGKKNPTVNEVYKLVAYTMRNNVPVSNLSGLVRQSMQKMRKVASKHKRYSDKDDLPLPRIPKTIGDEKVFVRRNKKKEKSPLDPNRKRRTDLSPDSMSGNEIEKSTKRLRTSRLMKRKGLNVHLPKKRTHPPKSQLNELQFNTQHFQWSDENDSEHERESNHSYSDDEPKIKSKSDLSENSFAPSMEYDDLSDENSAPQEKKEIIDLYLKANKDTQTKNEQPKENKEASNETKDTNSAEEKTSPGTSKDLEVNNTSDKTVEKTEDKKNLKDLPTTSKSKKEEGGGDASTIQKEKLTSTYIA